MVSYFTGFLCLTDSYVEWIPYIWHVNNVKKFVYTLIEFAPPDPCCSAPLGLSLQLIHAIVNVLLEWKRSIASQLDTHVMVYTWCGCVCVGVFHALIFAVADRKHRERPQVGSVVAGAIRIITFTLSISKYFSAMLIITISQGMWLSMLFVCKLAHTCISVASSSLHQIDSCAIMACISAKCWVQQ